MDTYTPIKIAYDLFEASKGSNPNSTPIILIHGLASDRHTWRDIAPMIAENTNRKVYAYDARSYGDSDYTDEFSFALNIDDLFHFMDTVNIEKAVLLGHSMGAYTVVNAALRKPEKVAMVISEDTYIKPLSYEMNVLCADYLRDLSRSLSQISPTTDEQEAIKIFVDEVYENLSEENKKWTTKDILYKVYVPFKRDSECRYLCNFNEEALCRAFRSPGTMQIEPVGSYEGPAVFLCGTKSILNVRSHESHIREHFPNAEFIDFEGGSHNLHAQFKKELTDVVVNILNKYNTV